MTTYSLSGSGTQALTAGTTALRVTITTLPAGMGVGRANPPNHFDIGLLRFGDGTAYTSPVAITGGPQWLGVPVGTTIVGYALLHGAVVSVDEVIGGVSPDPVIVLPGAGPVVPATISTQSAECLGVETAAGSLTVTSSSAFPTANLSILIPMKIAEQYTSAFAFTLNGSTASGHFDIGVYSASLVLLGHTGSVAQAGTTALQSVAFALTLARGFYYLAIACDVNTATFVAVSIGGSLRPRAYGVRAATGNFALASNPSPTTPGFGSVPVFGLSTYAP